MSRNSSVDGRFEVGLGKEKCDFGAEGWIVKSAAAPREKWWVATHDMTYVKGEENVEAVGRGSDFWKFSRRQDAACKDLAWLRIVRGSNGQELSPFHTGNRAEILIGVARFMARWRRHDWSFGLTYGHLL